MSTTQASEVVRIAQKLEEKMSYQPIVPYPEGVIELKQAISPFLQAVNAKPSKKIKSILFIMWPKYFTHGTLWEPPHSLK